MQGLEDRSSSSSSSSSAEPLDIYESIIELINQIFVSGYNLNTDANFITTFDPTAEGGFFGFGYSQSCTAAAG
jgi:hypothetical protein